MKGFLWSFFSSVYNFPGDLDPLLCTLGGWSIFFFFIVAWVPNLNSDASPYLGEYPLMLGIVFSASPYFGEYPLMLGIVFRVLDGDKSNFNMFPYK